MARNKRVVYSNDPEPAQAPEDGVFEDIDFQHPRYAAMLGKWEKCRDVCDGSEAVKEKTYTYLPRLTEQSDAEYQSYLRRAMFYGAAARTVRGLVGAVFLKDPSIKSSDDLITWMKDAGSANESFSEIMRKQVRETIALGRCGMLVDADGEGNLIQPYVCLYHAESIINWQFATIKGRRVPRLVVLYECVEKDVGFQTAIVEQWRRLSLDESGPVPVYQVEVFEEIEKGKRSASGKRLFRRIGGVTVPKMKGGKSLDYIPFQFVDPEGKGWEVVDPPTIDLVNINLSHYMTSADLEHGLHFTALPQAWVAGFSLEAPNVLTIGSTKAWVASDPHAQAGYLEFSGAGLSSLRDSKKDKEAQMAVAGSRMLEQAPGVQETATAVMIRHSSENSVLSDIAATCSQAASKVLTWVASWRGKPEDVEVALNRDYGTAQLDAQTINSLMIAMQQGGISFDTWFYNMQRGGMVPENRTIDEERSLIEAGSPMSSPAVVDNVLAGRGGPDAGGGGPNPSPAGPKPPKGSKPDKQLKKGAKP